MMLLELVMIWWGTIAVGGVVTIWFALNRERGAEILDEEAGDA